jgi:hypothetical protein
MDAFWKETVWSQFGAAIDMLEDSIRSCPEDVWASRPGERDFWYWAFHALFYLDLYLSESDKGFVPPVPFTIDEMDERGLLPDRVYTKAELLKYLEHGREKCRQAIADMTGEKAARRCGFYWLDITVADILLYNMRHVQHHVAQLNMILRQKADAAPGWVRKARTGLRAS